MEFQGGTHRKAPEDFLVPMEALNSIQSQGSVKHLSPVLPLENFKEMTHGGRKI